MSPQHQARGRLTLWRVSDGKAGHDSQSLGLAEALGRRRETDLFELGAQPLSHALRRWCSGRFPETNELPDPDLIIGAGHATHATLLAARRCRGGRAIVLMSPSLPTRWFDLCITPSHDGTRGKRVIQTKGALNRIRPGPSRCEGPGLILLGGPSRHVDWSDDTVLSSVSRILQADAANEWTLATSRRTPASLTQRLESLRQPKIGLVPHTETGPDWLPERLAAAGRVWVTEDSVSMIYEALTSAAAVGMIQLHRDPPGRIAAELDRLVKEGWLSRLAPDGEVPDLKPPAAILDEAGRCAELIFLRWPELSP